MRLVGGILEGFRIQRLGGQVRVTGTDFHFSVGGLVEDVEVVVHGGTSLVNDANLDHLALIGVHLVRIEVNSAAGQINTLVGGVVTEVVSGIAELIGHHDADAALEGVLLIGLALLVNGHGTGGGLQEDVPGLSPGHSKVVAHNALVIDLLADDVVGLVIAQDATDGSAVSVAGVIRGVEAHQADQLSAAVSILEDDQVVLGHGGLAVQGQAGAELEGGVARALRPQIDLEGHRQVLLIGLDSGAGQVGRVGELLDHSQDVLGGQFQGGGGAFASLHVVRIANLHHEGGQLIGRAVSDARQSHHIAITVVIAGILQVVRVLLDVGGILLIERIGCLIEQEVLQLEDSLVVSANLAGVHLDLADGRALGDGGGHNVGLQLHHTQGNDRARIGCLLNGRGHNVEVGVGGVRTQRQQVLNVVVIQPVALEGQVVLLKFGEFQFLTRADLVSHILGHLLHRFMFFIGGGFCVGEDHGIELGGSTFLGGYQGLGVDLPSLLHVHVGKGHVVDTLGQVVAGLHLVGVVLIHAIVRNVAVIGEIVRRRRL
ncbi:MAG: hypothetical protein NC311_10455, partial [Muribaculaceae bacterium]|nr:hypothetical protein [Muribaculaceae bacterium]